MSEVEYSDDEIYEDSWEGEGGEEDSEPAYEPPPPPVSARRTRPLTATRRTDNTVVPSQKTEPDSYLQRPVSATAGMRLDQPQQQHLDENDDDDDDEPQEEDSYNDDEFAEEEHSPPQNQPSRSSSTQEPTKPTEEEEEEYDSDEFLEGTVEVAPRHSPEEEEATVPFAASLILDSHPRTVSGALEQIHAIRRLLYQQHSAAQCATLFAERNPPEDLTVWQVLSDAVMSATFPEVRLAATPLLCEALEVIGNLSVIAAALDRHQSWDWVRSFLRLDLWEDPTQEHAALREHMEPVVAQYLVRQPRKGVQAMITTSAAVGTPDIKSRMSRWLIHVALQVVPSAVESTSDVVKAVLEEWCYDQLDDWDVVDCAVRLAPAASADERVTLLDLLLKKHQDHTHNLMDAATSVSSTIETWSDLTSTTMFTEWLRRAVQTSSPAVLGLLCVYGSRHNANRTFQQLTDVVEQTHLTSFRSSNEPTDLFFLCLCRVVGEVAIECEATPKQRVLIVQLFLLVLDAWLSSLPSATTTVEGVLSSLHALLPVVLFAATASLPALCGAHPKIVGGLFLMIQRSSPPSTVLPVVEGFLKLLTIVSPSVAAQTAATAFVDQLWSPVTSIVPALVLRSNEQETSNAFIVKTVLHRTLAVLATEDDATTSAATPLPCEAAVTIQTALLGLYSTLGHFDRGHALCEAKEIAAIFARCSSVGWSTTLSPLIIEHFAEAVAERDVVRVLLEQPRDEGATSIVSSLSRHVEDERWQGALIELGWPMTVLHVLHQSLRRLLSDEEQEAWVDSPVVRGLVDLLDRCLSSGPVPRTDAAQDALQFCRRHPTSLKSILARLRRTQACAVVSTTDNALVGQGPTLHETRSNQQSATLSSLWSSLLDEADQRRAIELLEREEWTAGEGSLWQSIAVHGYLTNVFTSLLEEAPTSPSAPVAPPPTVGAEHPAPHNSKEEPPLGAICVDVNEQQVTPHSGVEVSSTTVQEGEKEEEKEKETPFDVTSEPKEPTPMMMESGSSRRAPNAVDPPAEVVVVVSSAEQTEPTSETSIVAPESNGQNAEIDDAPAHAASVVQWVPPPSTSTETASPPAAHDDGPVPRRAAPLRRLSDATEYALRSEMAPANSSRHLLQQLADLIEELHVDLQREPQLVQAARELRDCVQEGSEASDETKEQAAREVGRLQSLRKVVLEVIVTIRSREEQLDALHTLVAKYERNPQYFSGAAIDGLLTSALRRMREASVAVMDAIGRWRPHVTTAHPEEVASLSESAVATDESVLVAEGEKGKKNGHHFAHFFFQGVDYNEKMKEDLHFLLESPIRKYLTLEVDKNVVLLAKRRTAEENVSEDAYRERCFFFRLSAPKGTLPIPRDAGNLEHDARDVLRAAEDDKVLVNSWFRGRAAQAVNITKEPTADKKKASSRVTLFRLLNPHRQFPLLSTTANNTWNANSVRPTPAATALSPIRNSPSRRPQSALEARSMPHHSHHHNNNEDSFGSRSVMITKEGIRKQSLRQRISAIHRRIPNSADHVERLQRRTPADRFAHVSFLKTMSSFSFTASAAGTMRPSSAASLRSTTASPSTLGKASATHSSALMAAASMTKTRIFGLRGWPWCLALCFSIFFYRKVRLRARDQRCARRIQKWYRTMRMQERYGVQLDRQLMDEPSLAWVVFMVRPQWLQDVQDDERLDLQWNPFLADYVEQMQDLDAVGMDNDLEADDDPPLPSATTTPTALHSEEPSHRVAALGARHATLFRSVSRRVPRYLTSPLLLRLLGCASTKIKLQYRAWKTRRYMKAVIPRAIAAIRIQRCVRSRRLARGLLLLALVVRTCWKIASWYRNCLVRTRQRAEYRRNRSALRIERWYRRRKAMERIREARRQRLAATTIQRHFRGQQGRQRAQWTRTCRVVGLFLKAKMWHRTLAKFLLQKECARRIQCVWRCFVARRRVAERRLLHRRAIAVHVHVNEATVHRECSSRISAWYRGYRTRSELRSAIVASLATPSGLEDGGSVGTSGGGPMPAHVMGRHSLLPSSTTEGTELRRLVAAHAVQPLVRQLRQQYSRVATVIQCFVRKALAKMQLRQLRQEKRVREVHFVAWMLNSRRLRVFRYECAFVAAKKFKELLKRSQERRAAERRRAEEALAAQLAREIAAATTLQSVWRMHAVQLLYREAVARRNEQWALIQRAELRIDCAIRIQRRARLLLRFRLWQRVLQRRAEACARTIQRAWRAVLAARQQVERDLAEFRRQTVAALTIQTAVRAFLEALHEERNM